MDRSKTIKDILSLLEDMNETQLQNVYDYACDEYDEENHESHSCEVIQQLVREEITLKK